MAPSGTCSLSNLTLLAALPDLPCLSRDFVALPFAYLFSLLTAARSLFKLPVAAPSFVYAGTMFSGKGSQAYSANQSAALGGLNRIYFGSVIAV